MKPVQYQGKLIGRTDNITYFTDRKPEHYFIKFNGFGISTQVLQALNGAEVKRIELTYKGTQGMQIWETTLKDFFEFGQQYNDKGDEQLVLNRKHWKIVTI
ncbi:MAG: hypothetical protein R3250_04025 [Melioribacteraceae bacterium]|nr:hypothetical protein [Melioribacteraceae bacterium]